MADGLPFPACVYNVILSVEVIWEIYIQLYQFTSILNDVRDQVL
jgi:hypothetical protein